MKYIKTTWYPLGRFIAITHYPIGVFYKGILSERTKNHEAIHWQQQKELWILLFYFIYLFEWIFKGYRNISFEKEAHDNDDNFNYLETRPRYAMWRKNRQSYGNN